MRAWPLSLRPLAFLGCAAGSVAITAGSLGYFDPDEVAPFVIEKLPLPLEALWLVALKVHVVAAAFALPACLALVSRTLVRHAPRLHRWLGRVTGAVVLLALAPSGFYLSLFATGGVLSTLGFMLSGAIVVAGMVRGVLAARARDFVAHRRAVLHVLAQLSVAVTSRALLFACAALGADPERAYVACLWLPVVASALAVERLMAHSRTASLPRREHASHSRPLAVPPHDVGVGGTARA